MEKPLEKPFEIRIVKTQFSPGRSNNYEQKPFSLFINGEEVQNVHRFSINLDRSKLIQERRISKHQKINLCDDWLYEIEHYFPVEGDMMTS